MAKARDYLSRVSSITLYFSTCSYFFAKVTYQYLLLLVGFDTLVYRKRYNRSPTVEGHQVLFSGSVAGSVALLVSEAGKEAFIFLLLFCCCYSLSLWTPL